MLKSILKRLAFGYRYDSNSYINHLRNIGMNIGDDVTIYVPTKTLIDEQYPWLISIGDHVRITEGVKILTHDFAWSVLKVSYEGEILGASGKVEIGNNVFIGMNTIICRNVKVGENVIIGAGSVVTKNCDNNSVYAGNPAQRIMSLEDYYQKRKERQLEEIEELAIEYYNRYKKNPPLDIFGEYFTLFSGTEESMNNAIFIKQTELCGNFDKTISSITLSKRPFDNYEQFMEYLSKEVEKHEEYQEKN